jgi:dTDP-L-rhamnose 4-epimerase
MSGKTVLLTGGAGFIGSHLAAALVERGHSVRVLDVMDPQVHGVDPGRPNPHGVEMVRGDLLDDRTLTRSLQGVEVVFHQAAAVGVGQSVYEPAAYTRVNSLGTALLMEKVARPGSKVEKVIVASSMSIYGEGKYRCAACGPVAPELRGRERLLAGKWEPACPRCGRDLEPIPTDEGKPLGPTSVYGVTKRSQEETVLVMGRCYGIPAVALRYFNVYGPGQALSNPYTGVAAIFSSRLLNGKPPCIYEDGEQGRDFVHVRDIVQANLLAMERSEADYQALNVGTGILTSVRQLVRGLIRRLAPDDSVSSRILGTFREGDIRHCYADITEIRTRLGYEPRVPLELGFDDLAAWARTQAPQDRFDAAAEELVSRGLVIGSSNVT